MRGLPGVFLMDDLHAYRRPLDNGWPFYVGLIFLALDDSIDELEMVQFLVHLQLLLFLLNGGYYSKFQFIRWQFIKSFTCIKLYDLLKYLRKLYYIFHKKKLLNRVDLILKK